MPCGAWLGVVLPRKSRTRNAKTRPGRGRVSTPAEAGTIISWPNDHPDKLALRQAESIAFGNGNGCLCGTAPLGGSRDPEGGALPFVDEIRRAVEAAPRVKLPEVARLLWQAVAAGNVTETEAEELAALIEARSMQTAARPAPRRVGARPRSPASTERRRTWAARGLLPPRLAARFTLAEAAVLAVVAAEIRRRGACNWAIGHIAAVAGVSETTCKRALREARALGFISIEERRVSTWRNDTNLVRIVSAEWGAWLRMGGGGQNRPGTNRTKITGSSRSSGNGAKGFRKDGGWGNDRPPSEAKTSFSGP